jgi:hypothetical protein
MPPPATAIHNTPLPELGLEPLGGSGATVGCGPGVGPRGASVGSGAVVAMGSGVGSPGAVVGVSTGGVVKPFGAEPRSSKPYPKVLSGPGLPRSFARCSMKSRTSSGFIRGLAFHTSAAAPATKGADALVPSNTLPSFP